ncbi:MAG: alpha/beta hydrolase domain-containing protein [Myxococcota bacterium]
MKGLARSLAILTCLTAWSLAGRAAAGPPTLLENPAGSGLHGHPYDAVPTTAAIPQAPVLDLEALGYVEREFQISGGATVYQQRGFWGSDGAWSVSAAQTNVPYTTRLLVRYPTDPMKFNGTVVFEWLNDTTGGDQDPLWSQIYQQALRDGYAYVGVTAQAAGMRDLAAWDPVRYGALGSSNDGQSYDIFTQAAQSVRANGATLLGGLTPSRLIGAGDSQSAFRIVTYVNAIQPVTHAFDGFLAVGRAAVGAPLGNGLISTSPLPALIRTDNRTPFIQLNTEGDIVELGAGLSRQADNNTLRTWELAGAAHIDAHEATYELATIARDQPTVPVPMCQFGTPITGTGTPLDGINQVNNMPLFEAEDAALVALHKWLSQGISPPHSPRISTTLFFFVYDVVQRDQYGNALGGIRLPDIQAPIESYSPINFSQVSPNSLNINPAALISLVQSTLTTLFVTGSIDDAELRSSGLCLLSGFFTPLSSSTLSRLYPTHSSYVSSFTAAANAAVSAGFLTPADRDAAVAAAQAAPIP